MEKKLPSVTKGYIFPKEIREPYWWIIIIGFIGFIVLDILVLYVAWSRNNSSETYGSIALWLAIGAVAYAIGAIIRFPWMQATYQIDENTVTNRIGKTTVSIHIHEAEFMEYTQKFYVAKSTLTQRYVVVFKGKTIEINPEGDFYRTLSRILKSGSVIIPVEGTGVGSKPLKKS